MKYESVFQDIFLSTAYNLGSMFLDNSNAKIRRVVDKEGELRVCSCRIQSCLSCRELGLELDGGGVKQRRKVLLQAGMHVRVGRSRPG